MSVTTLLHELKEDWLFYALLVLIGFITSQMCRRKS
jgi:hypothetical protein